VAKNQEYSTRKTQPGKKKTGVGGVTLIKSAEGTDVEKSRQPKRSILNLKTSENKNTMATDNRKGVSEGLKHQLDRRAGSGRDDWKGRRGSRDMSDPPRGIISRGCGK